MKTMWRGTAGAPLLLVASLTVGASARAEGPRPTTVGDGSAGHVIRLTPAELTWTAGPPMLPPGASMAVITVISGTFNMGFGDELDMGQGKTLPAGSIFEMPARIHHFGWTTEETIIQEHGIGPLSVHYLNRGQAGRQ